MNSCLTSITSGHAIFFQVSPAGKHSRTFRRMRRWWLHAVMIAFGAAAHAQLPGVPVQGLPRVELPATVNDTLGGVRNTVGNVAGQVDRLADVRRLRITQLLRTQRASVERDPAGQPILRAEIVAFDPTNEVVDRARAAGFEVARERVLDGLDARVVVFRAPDGMSTRRALARLRDLDPQGSYDYNHLYLESGVVGESAKEPTSGAPPGVAQAGVAQGATSTSSAPAAAAPALPGGSFKVGLIDGGVDAAHPVFKGAVLHQHGCNDQPVPSVHGTAVASLLVGKSIPFNGAAPGAELFAADVYCGLGAGGAVDVVADAIAWMARERVPVINVSLVGPRNLLLENVVKRTISRGHVIVAAVGTDGPAAPPLFPASYPDVIGVTGVDARRKVLLEAGRGTQVDFSAPGADMAAAGLAPTFAAVRGTSFAAPIVAGLLAASIREPDSATAAQAIAGLVQQAVDLGSRGVDKTYGNGLVGDGVRVQPAAALIGAPAAATATARH
jgi:hypothetical protein